MVFVKGNSCCLTTFKLLVCCLTGFIASNTSAAMPSWMEESRVQAQVGLYSLAGTEVFEKVPETLSALGFSGVYVRQVKQDWRPPLWPSSLPVNSDGIPLLKGARNYLKEIIEKSNEKNLKVIAYYWESGEGVFSTEVRSELGNSRHKYNWSAPHHWLCKDLNGKVLKVGLGKGRPIRGYHLDLATSDYKEFVLQRLYEMIEEGVSGFYFDERHYPKAQDSLCFGGELERKYIEQGGVLPLNESWDDMNYWSYAVHQGMEMAEFFKFLKMAVKEKYPEKGIVFIVSGTYLSSYIYPHMSLNLAEASDLIKVEYNHGIRESLNGRLFSGKSTLKAPSKDIRIALGWVVPRDASGAPTHVWHPDFGSVDQIKSFVAATQAYGLISSINLRTKYLSDRGKPVEVVGKEIIFREGAAYGRKLSRVMAYTRPLKNFLLYLNEDRRTELSNFSTYWSVEMKPIVEAFEYFIRAGVSSGVVTNNQLARGALDLTNTKVVFIPKGSVSKERKAVLQKKYKNIAFVDIDMSTIAEVVSFYKTMWVSGIDKSKAHSNFHIKKDSSGGIVVAITNDISEVGQSSYRKPKKVEGLVLNFREKISSVKDVENNNFLEIYKEAGVFKVKIPDFSYSTNLLVRY